jgi:hypothetical protein
VREAIVAKKLVRTREVSDAVTELALQPSSAEVLGIGYWKVTSALTLLPVSSLYQRIVFCGVVLSNSMGY